MRLKARNFNWLAGRPVVILDEVTAKKLNIHTNERVELVYHSRKIYAVVDIFSKVVNKNEVGLSNEITSLIKTKKNSFLEVSPAELTKTGLLIKKKLAGKRLSKEELNLLISEISHNKLTESEISYFVAAEKIRGLSKKEVVYLTEAMVKNGEVLRFNKKIVADKHCIGGVAGNRTTPIVVAICAAAGLTIPKNSSRAITSASGTADVIETIAMVDLNLKEIKRVVRETNGCFVWGGSLGLAPSDDKIIHVERALNLDVKPQLLSSIMSKKIAAGSNHILIDIPYGRGAKVSNKKEAYGLATKFQQLAKHFKVKLKIVYTKGNQPVGKGIGPVLEMLDVLSVLQNKQDSPRDLKEKSLLLSSELMTLCKIKNSKKLARGILESGKAYEKFKEIINAQNKKDNCDSQIKKLKLATLKKTISSKKSGRITEIDNEKINSLCRVLGTPESKSAGVYLHNPVGKIKKGEKLITLYSESREKLRDGLRFFKENKPIVLK